MHIPPSLLTSEVQGRESPLPGTRYLVKMFFGHIA